ncbi:MAG: hypothetical protein HQL06_00125 [Nitrospirae bacterium]|nr:hypothetical protein [Nitrospirota bacterium]
MSVSQFKEKPACSVKVPVPEMIACSGCGYENEVWNDEEQPVCVKCGASLKATRTS